MGMQSDAPEPIAMHCRFQERGPWHLENAVMPVVLAAAMCLGKYLYLGHPPRCVPMYRNCCYPQLSNSRRQRSLKWAIEDRSVSVDLCCVGLWRVVEGLLD